jgi:serine/threonine-protein kinase
MIRCNNCGTENLDGSEYCDECGVKLEPSYRPPSAVRTFEGLPTPPSFAAPNPPQLFSPGRGTEVLGSKPDARADKPRALAKLVIERGGRIGKEFLITGPETHIGRWDADNGIFPDVDLDQDDPEAKVSRRHARIINQNGRFFIEDLGSTNGTFVNRGRRLLPGHWHALENGDEIIVGKTFLKFHILE